MLSETMATDIGLKGKSLGFICIYIYFWPLNLADPLRAPAIFISASCYLCKYFKWKSHR
jgi:hypothetical protein